MRIEAYEFGRITVDGRTYTSDVILYPDRVDASWWRKEGHRLDLDDLRNALLASPQVLVIGTGAHGVMDVPEKTRRAVEAKGIRVIVEKTGQAVEIFNSLLPKARIVACLHLTC